MIEFVHEMHEFETVHLTFAEHNAVEILLVLLRCIQVNRVGHELLAGLLTVIHVGTNQEDLSAIPSFESVQRSINDVVNDICNHLTAVFRQITLLVHWNFHKFSALVSLFAKLAPSGW